MSKIHCLKHTTGQVTFQTLIVHLSLWLPDVHKSLPVCPHKFTCWTVELFFFFLTLLHVQSSACYTLGEHTLLPWTELEVKLHRERRVMSYVRLCVCDCLISIDVAVCGSPDTTSFNNRMNRQLPVSTIAQRDKMTAWVAICRKTHITEEIPRGMSSQQ